MGRPLGTAFGLIVSGVRKTSPEPPLWSALPPAARRLFNEPEPEPESEPVFFRAAAASRSDAVAVIGSSAGAIDGSAG